MKTAKRLSMFVAVTSGVLTVIGIVAFFSQPETAMPVVATITVSAFGLSLSSGIVWASIVVVENLEELVVSHGAPVKKGELYQLPRAADYVRAQSKG